MGAKRSDLDLAGRSAQSFTGIMRFAPNRTPAMGFPFADAIHDCEQMQRVVEVILDEARLHSWESIKDECSEAYNALQTAINELETCRDGWLAEEEKRIHDEWKLTPDGIAASEAEDQKRWREECGIAQEAERSPVKREVAGSRPAPAAMPRREAEDRILLELMFKGAAADWREVRERLKVSSDLPVEVDGVPFREVFAGLASAGRMALRRRMVPDSRSDESPSG